MTSTTTKREKRFRPFIKLPHIEELELDNRNLAIYARLLWYLSDEVWRREGLPGVATVREEALRQIAGTKRLDHAEEWLRELLDQFDGSIWSPVIDEEGGLEAAWERLADRLPGLGHAKSQLSAAKSSRATIRGFIFFRNYAESQGLDLQNRLELAIDEDQDTHLDEKRSKEEQESGSDRTDEVLLHHGSSYRGPKSLEDHSSLDRVSSDRVPHSPAYDEPSPSSYDDGVGRRGEWLGPDAQIEDVFPDRRPAHDGDF